jgi:hypothetical protein
MRQRLWLLVIVGSLGSSLRAQGPTLNNDLQALAADFFAWRSRTQPCTPDDIPRIERPADWLPDFSAPAVDTIRLIYREYRDRLEEISRENWTRADSVDYLLLRSAIERVHWEFDVLQIPVRNPDFYVQQTLGLVYESLYPSPDMTPARIEKILSRLRHIPVALSWARENLSDPVQPYAEIAIGNLRGARTRLGDLMKALRPICDSRLFKDLNDAAVKAADSLEAYDGWLKEQLPSMKESFSIGGRAYRYFLQNVALIPWSTDDMLLAGRSEFDRAIAFEQIEKRRNAGLPEPRLFATVQQQIDQEKKDEETIRKFLTEKGLLSIPSWVRHYRIRLAPSYLRAFEGLGEMDDLTSRSRLAENGTAYVPAPSPDLSYFRKASAQDPRPIIIHEGVPGHYFQLVMSWANADPIRRNYFDSGSNEGWGFYVEEMMLQAGLFDRDRPRAREVIYNFMRLRALRVEADIQLALGEFTIRMAGDYMASHVPMDTATAMHEAAFFASSPGQAITYQIGKLQILKFLSDARSVQGEKFDLRAFHDYIVQNGNVPIALMRWEFLGLPDEIEKLW